MVLGQGAFAHTIEVLPPGVFERGLVFHEGVAVLISKHIKGSKEC